MKKLVIEYDDNVTLTGITGAIAHEFVNEEGKMETSVNMFSWDRDHLNNLTSIYIPCKDKLEPVYDEFVDVDKQTIYELDLSFRSHNCLERAGIKTIGQLRKMTKYDLSLVRGLGRRGLYEIKDKLKERYGIELEMGQTT